MVYFVLTPRCFAYRYAATTFFQLQRGFGGRRQHARIQEFLSALSVLILFYSLQRGPMVLLLRKLYLYFTKDPEGVHYFPGRGGGPYANFLRNPYAYLLFSRGGGLDPLSPSGSAHGQCHHNGTIFITVPLLTIIVRH